MAILTLALGVGANTAIFSVVNAVLLRPLDFKSPGNLYVLSMEDVKKHMTGGNFGYIFFQALRDQTPDLEGIAAFSNDTFNLVGGQFRNKFRLSNVSSSFFDVLGIHPTLGRSFLKPRRRAGRSAGRNSWPRFFGCAASAVIQVWLATTSRSTASIRRRRNFGSRIGRSLPASGCLGSASMRNQYSSERIQTGSGYLNAIAPAAQVSQRKQGAELDSSAHQYEHAFPANSDASFDTTINVQPISDNALGGVRATLWVLLGAVGFVLLIVCANVANLFLARAAGRQKEIAIRSALGASRSRLVRQFLTESTMLAVTGGAIGILVAAWGVRLLAASPALGVPRSNEIAVNGAVLIFSLGISFLAGILFGIVPAWRTSRINLSEIMNEASRGSSAGARRNRAGALIIIAELGFSVVLLAGAGLLLQSFYRLLHVRLGFEPQIVLTFQIALPPTKYPQPFQKTEFHQQLREHVATIPGVRSVASALPVPPFGSLLLPYRRRMPPDLPRGQRPIALWNSISPDYFQTLGISLLESEVFGRRYSKIQSGRNHQSKSRRSSVGSPGSHRPAHSNCSSARAREIVEVVSDLRNRGVGADMGDRLYTPASVHRGTMSLLIENFRRSYRLFLQFAAQFRQLAMINP